MTTAPSQILMVEPTFFEIAYAINPHMVNADGTLKKVNKEKAQNQWTHLKETIEKLGVKVIVLKGVPGLPDMVFAANQSFVYYDKKTLKKKAVMSHMSSAARRPEVPYFEKWYRESGYDISSIRTSFSFEGTGDALFYQNVIWAGFGFRTEKMAYNFFDEPSGFKINYLQLVDPEFYHLDTCFSILDSKTVVICKDAFNEKGLETIHSGFERVIYAPRSESIELFVCNCFCPNGRDVIVQTGSEVFKKNIVSAGFIIHEVDTSEFIKAGGSVFCMKMVLV